MSLTIRRVENGCDWCHVLILLDWLQILPLIPVSEKDMFFIVGHGLRYGCCAKARELDTTGQIGRDNEGKDNK